MIVSVSPAVWVDVNGADAADDGEKRRWWGRSGEINVNN